MRKGDRDILYILRLNLEAALIDLIHRAPPEVQTPGAVAAAHASYPPANSFNQKAQGLIYSVTGNVAVPEPGALGLVLASLCCAGLLFRRRG